MPDWSGLKALSIDVFGAYWGFAIEGGDVANLVNLIPVDANTSLEKVELRFRHLRIRPADFNSLLASIAARSKTLRFLRLRFLSCSVFYDWDEHFHPSLISSTTTLFPNLRSLSLDSDSGFDEVYISMCKWQFPSLKTLLVRDSGNSFNRTPVAPICHFLQAFEDCPTRFAVGYEHKSGPALLGCLGDKVIVTRPFRTLHIAHLTLRAITEVALLNFRPLIESHHEYAEEIEDFLNALLNKSYLPGLKTIKLLDAGVPGFWDEYPAFTQWWMGIMANFNDSGRITFVDGFGRHIPTDGSSYGPL